MSSDTLSDVLRAVRLGGAIYFDVAARAPWVAEAPPASKLAPFVMPGAEHVIEFHLVVSGTCFAGLVDETPEQLATGDLIIFPQGDSHVLSSAPGMRGTPDVASYQLPSGSPLPISIQEGGSGEGAAVICGFFGCDVRPFNPLLATLPRMLIVRQEELTTRSFSPLTLLIQAAVSESQRQRPGSECVLSRLSELLFVQAIRVYVETLPPEQRGWLGGLRDPHVGRALAALHQEPTRAWTLDELANQAGQSRSLFAERFMHFVGIPPIQYLAQWRMQLAAARLRTTNESLAEIAERVGYGSESAFSRAFKRLVGVPPASFRQVQTLR